MTYEEARDHSARVLAQLPIANAGQWIKVDTNMYTCSNCSHCFTLVPEDNHISQFKYCPNCRYKMEVSEYGIN